MEKELGIALVQTNSTADYPANLAFALKEIATASTHPNCKLIAFPENFLFLGSEAPPKEVAVSVDKSDKVISVFCEAAAKYKISILLGSVLEKTDGDRVSNTSVYINNKGTVLATYRKIHLFDIELPDVILKESETVKPGSELVVVEDFGVKIGLSICYDIRFGYIYNKLSERGAQILMVPAAFSVPTGKDHWETLLRARAIENQCYVLAPAQIGTHNAKRQSYGSTMCVDPWGFVTARASNLPSTIFASINLSYLEKVRRNMPVLSHRVKQSQLSVKLAK